MLTVSRLIRNPYVIGAFVLLLAAGSFFLYTYLQSLPRMASESELYDVSYWKSRTRAASAAQAYREAVESVPHGSPLKKYHEIGHVLGSALYDVEGLDAITACDAMTVYGCFHEIIRQYMRDHSTTDLDPLSKRCDELLGFDISWMCKHSIGHGLVLQNGKTLDALNTSLAQCDKVSPLENTESCHAGVFMEYDYDLSEAGDLEKARPMDQNNLYSPCFDVDEKYFIQCIRRRPYWWVIALHKIPQQERYAQLMAFCRDSRIQGIARTQCIEGVALQMVLYEDNDQDFSQRCKDIANSTDERAICENGMRLAVDMLLPENRY